MDCQASSSKAGADVSGSAALATQKLNSGLEHFQAGRLDDALQQLGEALELRISLHGGTATECSGCYHHYGAALFAKAQEDSDVLGAAISQPAALPQPDMDKENRKGKGKIAVDKETEADDGEEDEDDSDTEEEANDMQLAWEMLELAKLCYSSDKSLHKQELADVHILLGDIGMEQEAFDGAFSDYQEAISFLDNVQGIERKLAELHYKTALALQYLDDPEQALHHSNVAIGHCNSHLQGLQAGPADASGEDSKGADIADLKGILAEMQAKADDLQEAIKLRTSTKNAMKAAFLQLAKAADPSQQAVQPSAPPSEPAAPLSVSNARTADSAVQDLGVVGRGSKRIRLTPAPLSGPDNAGNSTQPSSASAPAQSKPSRLDALMNSGQTQIGFGQPSNAQVPKKEPEKGSVTVSNI